MHLTQEKLHRLSIHHRFRSKKYYKTPLKTPWKCPISLHFTELISSRLFYVCFTKCSAEQYCGTPLNVLKKTKNGKGCFFPQKLVLFVNSSFIEIFVMLCVIWYYSDNLKIHEKHQWRSFTFSKGNTPLLVFFMFFKLRKSHKASHLMSRMF